MCSKTHNALPQWVDDLAPRLDLCLSAIHEENGRVRWCKEGDIWPVGGLSGLDPLCFAVKIFVMLGLWRAFSEEKRQACLDRIFSFQQQEGRYAGYFMDPWLLKQAGDPFWKRNMELRRAETRTAMMALLAAGQAPLNPLPDFTGNACGVQSFLKKQPWSNPWAAGSHAAILLQFLYWNNVFFPEQARREKDLQVALDFIDSLQNPENGCWEKRCRKDNARINGAMKILFGFETLGRELKYPEKLIDYALRLINAEDGCHNADLLYVFQQALKFTDHRRAEIEDLAFLRFEIIEKFRKEDGGFSFRPEGASKSYYGARVSKGAPVSDIHGCLMFTWTSVLILDILGRRSEFGFSLFHEAAYETGKQA